MNSTDYDDLKLEADWLAQQRATILKHLQDEGIQHGGLEAEPDWFLAPYVSIWMVESKLKPDTIGWWAISGDLPTDYLYGAEATNARGAMRAFADRWKEVSAYMLRGEQHPKIKIGPPEQRHQNGDLLSRRAAILETWANDDDMW